QLVGAAQLIAGLPDAPLASQPLAVQQLRTAQFDAQRCAAEDVDGHAIAGLGIVAVADQCTRAGLDATCPVRAAAAGGDREPLQRISCTFAHTAVCRCLDQLDQRPVGLEAEPGERVPADLLRCGKRSLIVAQAVAQHCGGPPDEGKPCAFTSALC